MRHKIYDYCNILIFGIIFAAIFHKDIDLKGGYVMKRKNNYTVPKQIKSILDLKSRMSKNAGREISFSEALACWLAFGYGDSFVENYQKSL